VKCGSVLRLTSTASRRASPNENGGYRCISLSDAACTLNPPQRTRQQALRDAPVSTHLVKRRYFATTIQPSVWRKLLRLRQSMRGPFSTPPDPDRLLAQPANVHSLHGTKRTSPAARIAQQSSRKKSRLSATGGSPLSVWVPWPHPCPAVERRSPPKKLTFTEHEKQSGRALPSFPNCLCRQQVPETLTQRYSDRQSPSSRYRVGRAPANPHPALQQRKFLNSVRYLARAPRAKGTRPAAPGSSHPPPIWVQPTARRESSDSSRKVSPCRRLVPSDDSSPCSVSVVFNESGD